jgi:hypothetical protein
LGSKVIVVVLIVDLAKSSTSEVLVFDPPFSPRWLSETSWETEAEWLLAEDVSIT